MAQYPALLSSPGPTWGFRQRIETKTLRTEFNDVGAESRKQIWLYPRRHFELQYNYLDEADAQTLWEFYIARNGQYNAFRIIYPWSLTYSGEYVGTGDGSTTSFNLPSNQATARTLYVDSSSQSESSSPADWTFTSEGGTDGADLCEFASAPASGTRITFDFTGYLVIRAVFREDTMDMQTFVDRATSVGLKIRGLLNS
jgi:hypothetical protein